MKNIQIIKSVTYFNDLDIGYNEIQEEIWCLTLYWGDIASRREQKYYVINVECGIPFSSVNYPFTDISNLCVKNIEVTRPIIYEIASHMNQTSL